MIGRVLDDRYRILRRVARGGMAAVYEATDLRLDRTVAVKVMHPGLGDDEVFAARFVGEARSAARLTHPHVVAVHDQGEDDGQVFLVMEYVPGHTLRDVIDREAPLPAARALALLEPVLSALAAAHRAGLVHRDVKPENVLIADESAGGQVKVADFGLAKAVSSQTRHTATGVLIGTVSYLAPEVIVHGHADERADVYAAGVLLFELLTGTKPHEGESQIQVAYRAVHEDVPAPSSRVPGVAAYVDALVARATARDRDQRPADAGVLLHQVHRVQQALRDGLDDDPELTQDLAPVVPAAPLAVEVDADRDGLLDLEDAGASAGLHGQGRPDGTDGKDGTDHTRQFEAPVLAPDLSEPAPEGAVTPGEGRPAPVGRLARPSSGVGPPPARRSRRGLWVLLAVLLLVVGVGAGAWWYGVARYTSTPGVIGMTEDEAVATLEEVGLESEIGPGEYSETVRRGLVLTSDPGAGDRVRDGGTVVLTLSLGKERYDVPALEGMTLDEAQDALQATKLAFGRAVERWSEEVPEGTVMSSDPAAGTRLKPQASVNVVVSKGRRPRKVGDFTGRSADRAEEVLTGRGLQVTREEVFSDEVEEGLVISQDPREGTLYQGDTVALVVSKGPELVDVPNVVAQGVDSARSELEGLGFEVRVERSGNYVGLGFVINQDPGRGQSAPRGSVVTIYLV